MNRQRDLSIDFLRCVGACVVIAAHVGAPDWLFQLRNFGTPMLIVVSALSAAVVYGGAPMDAWAFLRRRMVKLTVPVWTFLTIFFALACGYASLRGKPVPFTLDQAIDSYALRSGIGYVWIFRVYIGIALLTPLLMWARSRVVERRHWFIALGASGIAYEVLLALMRGHVGEPQVVQVLEELVFTVMPYAMLFAYGLVLSGMSDAAVARTAAVSLLVFAVMAAFMVLTLGRFVPTQEMKYPPTLYYLSYAFFWINVLVLVARSRLVARLPAAALTWFSSHLLWIYLWHILAIFAWDQVVGAPGGRLGLSMLKMAAVVGFGVGVTWCQQRLLALLAPSAAAPPRMLLRTMLG